MSDIRSLSRSVSAGSQNGEGVSETVELKKKIKDCVRYHPVGGQTCHVQSAPYQLQFA